MASDYCPHKFPCKDERERERDVPYCPSCMWSVARFFSADFVGAEHGRQSGL